MNKQNYENPSHDDLPCKCGHFQEEHTIPNLTYGRGCRVCYWYLKNGTGPECHYWREDHSNLALLEALVRRKELTK